VATIFTFNARKVSRILDEYLVYGGFPEIYDSDELERKEVMQEYFRTLVQRDLIERFSIRQEALLKATIKLVLNSLTISISKLTKTLKDKSTVLVFENT